jgi:hypothetical protein
VALSAAGFDAGVGLLLVGGIEKASYSFASGYNAIETTRCACKER